MISFSQIQDFFSADLTVKKILVDLTYKDEYNNKYGAVYYGDKLYKGLDFLEYYIPKLCNKEIKGG